MKMNEYKVLINTDQEIVDHVKELVECGLNFEVTYSGFGNFPATLKYESINDIFKDKK